MSPSLGLLRWLRVYGDFITEGKVNDPATVAFVQSLEERPRRTSCPLFMNKGSPAVWRGPSLSVLTAASYFKTFVVPLASLSAGSASLCPMTVATAKKVTLPTA